MEDSTIVLYSAAEHLNTMLILAKFITKNLPSVPVLILCSAADSAAASVADFPSITYRRIPAAGPLPATVTDPVEMFFETVRVNNPNLREALQEISRESNIKAFVIDFFCNSAFDVSTSLDIPTYFYLSNGGLGACIFLYLPTLHENVGRDIADLNDFLEIPGCPLIHSSDMPKAMLYRQSNVYKHFLNTAVNIRKSKGILLNSFDALEYREKEALSNGLCVPNGATPPVYFIGPLVSDPVRKSGGARDHECIKWLDLQPSRSVIFLCFGRRGLFSTRQLKEIAIGLENSGYRFLWSVRPPPEKRLQSAGAEDFDLQELLPEQFLERTKERGFIIKSWAPQTEVLSHGSVAGFVTHCGRSSILEAISFGVPMIGWPLYAEQRMNRVSVVEQMKLGLPLEELEDGFVTAAELEKRVRELMECKAGRELRHRAYEMKVAAQEALRRNGSSPAALEKFIQALLVD